MIQTVLFRKGSIGLHREIKAVSAVKEIPVYKLYNLVMKEFSARMKEENLPIYFTFESTDKYKDIRVEKVDSEIYKSFRITCIQKDISISQGINLALVSWLEVCENDISSLELRT